MSIINDALKKAEKRRDGDPRGKEQAQEKHYSESGAKDHDKPERPAKKPSSAWPRGRSITNKKEFKLILSVAAGAIVLSLVVLVILLRGGFELSFIPLTPADIKIQETPKAPAEQGPAAEPQPAVKADDELTLTGIVHGEGMPMAVINGSVYIEGDSIKKSRIIKITEDKVILDKDGRILELQVR